MKEGKGRKRRKGEGGIIKKIQISWRLSLKMKPKDGTTEETQNKIDNSEIIKSSTSEIHCIKREEQRNHLFFEY